MPRKPRPPIDRLERERNAGRLGLAAYGAACIYRTIQRDAEPHQFMAGPHSSPVLVGASIDQMRIAAEHRSLVCHELGQDAAILDGVLMGRLTFKQIAAERGYPATPRGELRAGDDFRNACQALAVLYASRKAESLPSRRDETYAE